MDYAYYNGIFAPYEKINIPLSDRSVYFGDGVYDCMIGRLGAVFQFNEHMARLHRSAEYIHLSFSHSDNEIMSVIKRLIDMSELNEYVIYIQLSRTSERRVHSCSDFEKSSLLITLCGHVTNENSDTVNLLLEDDIRYKMCNVKSLNLLPAVLSSQRASNAGFDETVFVRDGIVTECSKSNIFAIFSNKIVTHPESRYILPGITRKTVINTAETLGIKVEERCFTPEELFESDGAFITSTTKLIRRVHKIDNFTISDVSKELINGLFESILGDYHRFCC